MQPINSVIDSSGRPVPNQKKRGRGRPRKSSLMPADNVSTPGADPLMVTYSCNYKAAIIFLGRWCIEHTFCVQHQWQWAWSKDSFNTNWIFPPSCRYNWCGCHIGPCSVLYLSHLNCVCEPWCFKWVAPGFRDILSHSRYCIYMCYIVYVTLSLGLDNKLRGFTSNNRIQTLDKGYNSFASFFFLDWCIPHHRNSEGSLHPNGCFLYLLLGKGL